MIDQCPHCQQDLKLNEAQIAKVDGALAKLPEGKSLKMGCPHCQKPIELKADGSAAQAKDSSKAAASGRPTPKPINPPPAPPKTPDLDWLKSGEFQKEEVIEDVPSALILVQDQAARATISEAFTETGYNAVIPDSADNAIERMRFVNFKAVVFHSGFEGGELDASSFHAHMKKMPMAKRRHIFYVLVGPRLNTLYDLEALTNSANLVVNDNEISKFNIILKKSLQDYEDLFGPYIGHLKKAGKL